MKILILILFISSSIYCQIDLSRLSLDIGYVSNYQVFNNYLFTPEIKIGGSFLHEKLEWEVHSSYWDEGVSKEMKVTVSESPLVYHSNITIGSKIYFIPTQNKINLLLNSGFSYRNIKQKYYVRPYSPEKNIDKKINTISLDLGIGIGYNIISRLRMRTELNVYLVIASDKKHYDELHNGALKIGMDYFIK